MSAKRARYDGPFQEVQVQDSEAGIYSEVYVVKRGGLLPLEAGARVRDELLQDADAWSEVKQADQKKDGDA